MKLHCKLTDVQGSKQGGWRGEGAQLKTTLPADYLVCQFRPILGEIPGCYDCNLGLSALVVLI